MSSYDEHLISQAGGDGDDNRDVALYVSERGDPEVGQRIQFTNVPMHRVHAAIALLNDEVRPPLTEADIVAWRKSAPYPIPTDGFTMTELFPGNGVTVHDECAECGAKVLNYGKHVEWHNKLLP